MIRAQSKLQGWVRRSGFAAGVGVFLILSGCHSGNKDNTEIPRQDTSPAYSPPAAESPKPATPTMTLIGPRSQEDLEECFAVPKNVSFNSTPRTGSATPAVSYALSGPVTAGAGWDVKITRDWKSIVVHHSASAIGSAAIFDRAHKARGWDGLGYHFVIGNGEGSGDGQVEVGYRWSQQLRGAHAGNIDYNEHGIGICLVGNFEDSRPTAKQMESLRTLVKFLMSKTGISTASIIGHGDVPGKDTRCPGKLFDMSAFRSSVAGGKTGDSKALAQDTPRPVPMSSTRPAKRTTANGGVMP